jgi:hypothetical protein
MGWAETLRILLLKTRKRKCRRTDEQKVKIYYNKICFSKYMAICNAVDIQIHEIIRQRATIYVIIFNFVRKLLCIQLGWKYKCKCKSDQITSFMTEIAAVEAMIHTFEDVVV